MEISLAAEPLFHIGPLVVSNSMLISWVIALFLIVLSVAIYTGYDRFPGKLKMIIEMVIESLRSLVVNVAGEKANAIFPLIATFFIFILLCNWVSVLPGVGTIGIHGEVHGKEMFIPILRGPTADLNLTLALALVSVTSIQYFSIKYLGVGGWLKRFFNFRNPIDFFVGILDLISEFAKIISFCFRLFGNVFAGEVLLAVMLFLVPFIAPIPFLGLEIFVGFIQALVFSMLSLVFISVATSHE